jgi:hypothetical protein
MNKDSKLIWEQYQNLIEAPVDDIQTMGNWNKATKSKNKYDSSSIKLLNNPEYIKRLKTKFASNVPYIFNLYFIKSPKASQHVEYGPITEEKLREFISDVDVSPIINASKANPESITIIFTNNSGVEKIPLTPWMIAHRISHSMYRSQFSYDSYNQLSNEYKHFLRQINSTLEGCYNIRGGFFSRDEALVKLVNGLGTFRSARENKITRPFEFIHEVFAQYLTTGNIEFNSYNNDELCADQFKTEFESSIYYILNKCKGKMFLM